MSSSSYSYIHRTQAICFIFSINSIPLNKNPLALNMSASSRLQNENEQQEQEKNGYEHSYGRPLSFVGGHVKDFGHFLHDRV